MTLTAKPDAPVFPVTVLTGPEQLYPGITVAVLAYGTHPETGEQGPARLLVQFAPGAAYPEPDVHTDSAERVQVLNGELADNGLHDAHGAQIREGRRFPAGKLAFALRGSWHQPYSPSGCLLLVEYLDLL